MSAIIVFAVVFFAAGCLIAYWGDRLGTFVGKRRLSRFGLRPKHTAILYTTCSGGLIAILTVVILFNYDKGVKYALVHGRQLAVTIHRQSEQIQSNQSELSADRIQLANARSAVSVIERQLSLSQKQLATKQILLTATETELATGKAELSATKVKLAQTRNVLSATEVRLASTSTDLSRTNRELSGTEKQLVSTKHDYSREQTLVKLLQTRQHTLSALNQTLTASNAALDEKNTALSTSGMVFRVDQEVGDRVVIPTSLSVEDSESKLQAWLAALNHRAASLGVGVGSDGRALVVEVQNAGPGQPISQNDIVEALARSIAAQTKVVSSIVVVAKARVNIVAGQPGRIALYPWDNVLAFSKDQKIASIVIDGRLPTDQILSDLQTFLTRSVRPVAQTAGIIPTYDRETGQLSYGRPISDWMSVVKRIQSFDSNAVVTAVAADDTYTAGPLQLSLVALPADNSAYKVNLGNDPTHYAPGPSVAAGSDPTNP